MRLTHMSGPRQPDTSSVTSDPSPARRFPRDLALSRAGAMAVVLSHVRRTPALTVAARTALLFGGSALIALGVAGLLWTRLGPGPLDVLITAISARWSISITFAVWGVAAFMMISSFVLGRRPGLGTLALPLISGALLPVAIAVLDTWTAPAGLSVLGVAVHIAAVGTVGFGAGMVIVAGLGAGMGELLATAASDRMGRPEPLVRTGIELSWLVVGIALGGTAGWGTVVVTLLIGPSVRLGHRGVLALLSQPTAQPVPV
jgi:uncharacterized membrane protein YczE